MSVARAGREALAYWGEIANKQEAIRDLSRLRGDTKAQEYKTRQQSNAFVLRQGHPWLSTRSRWTQAHYAWLESLTFAHA